MIGASMPRSARRRWRSIYPQTRSGVFARRPGPVPARPARQAHQCRSGRTGADADVGHDPNDYRTHPLFACRHAQAHNPASHGCLKNAFQPGRLVRGAGQRAHPGRNQPSSSRHRIPIFSFLYLIGFFAGAFRHGRIHPFSAYHGIPAQNLHGFSAVSFCGHDFRDMRN